VNALREALGTPRTHPDHSACEQEMAHLRAALGERTFAINLAAGRALSLQQAIVEARPDAKAGASAAELTVRAAPGLLTQREWEVAALVAQRLSNRQIGETLVITGAPQGCMSSTC
jgi:ATP/maltotriose-dependent transcriptional regulator MalT